MITLHVTAIFINHKQDRHTHREKEIKSTAAKKHRKYIDRQVVRTVEGAKHP